MTTIKQLIQVLQKAAEQYGDDLPVYVYDSEKGYLIERDLEGMVYREVEDSGYGFKYPNRLLLSDMGYLLK